MIDPCGYCGSDLDPETVPMVCCGLLLHPDCHEFHADEHDKALRTAARRYVAAWRGLDVELDDDAEEAGEQFAARLAAYRDTLAALVAAVDAELLDAERAAREAAERERDDAIAENARCAAADRACAEAAEARILALADARDAAEARTHALEAAARCLLDTSVSDPAWGDRAAELRALVDGGA